MHVAQEAQVVEIAPVTIPPFGGYTEFADLRAAYDTLPDATKQRIEGLVAEHSLAYSRARTGFSNFTEAEREGLPAVPQVIARTIPENGRAAGSDRRRRFRRQRWG
jgi:alpha-ketoglutarate-dependent 2,4-dichlorophenoxyacetate dioxygenase